MRFALHLAACHPPNFHDHRHGSAGQVHFTPGPGLFRWNGPWVVRSVRRGENSVRAMIMSAAASDSVGPGTHDQGIERAAALSAPILTLLLDKSGNGQR